MERCDLKGTRRTVRRAEDSSMKTSSAASTIQYAKYLRLGGASAREALTAASAGSAKRTVNAPKRATGPTVQKAARPTKRTTHASGSPTTSSSALKTRSPPTNAGRTRAAAERRRRSVATRRRHAASHDLLSSSSSSSRRWCVSSGRRASGVTARRTAVVAAKARAVAPSGNWSQTRKIPRISSSRRSSPKRATAAAPYGSANHAPPTNRSAANTAQYRSSARAASVAPPRRRVSAPDVGVVGNPRGVPLSGRGLVVARVKLRRAASAARTRRPRTSAQSRGDAKKCRAAAGATRNSAKTRHVNVTCGNAAAASRDLCARFARKCA
mmetsp:Transcript_17534/g.53466  ORF Transcript_17534/g.53466 Transcript_17534/m.53466 type:complete len:326 (+) Transcript_17534:542-1519(+)